MFTTDGAMPSLLRRARRDRRRAADRDRAAASSRCARCRWRRSTRRRSCGSTRSWAGSRPGAARRSTSCPRSASGGRSACSSTGAGSRATAALVCRRPTIDWPAGPGLVAPPPSAFAPLTGMQPVARYESAVINRRVDREVRTETPGRARRPRRLVGHEGRRRELPAGVDGFATTATTSLELLVARDATRRRWPARRRGWPRWAAGSRSTAAGARRSRSTG